MRKAILMRTLAKNEVNENDPPADNKDVQPQEPMPSFEPIEDNIYLFDRKKCKNKKDIKRMVCDCILTKEERQRNVVGCGEDCLNRMLMIECGSRCPLGDHCANKRFQKRQYASVEPFYAGRKGWGLRATKALPPGAFVMEYIGEVVDAYEFKNRVKKYAKEKYVHHYFMALKSDEIIDATIKGNITRFVNHSCDPNSETQKWTINGELRIGFFTTRVVEAGEEITFDYQFQRYGKEAQKCYCESPNCRGYIGASEVSTIDLDGTRIAPKQRAKISEIDQKLKRSQEFEDLALDDEVDKLYVVGSIRNRQQTLTIARLMVRAEDQENRRKLLEIIKNTQEVAYLRLFLDYHGLQLLWSWMVDIEDPWLRVLILEVLEVLPVPNKTMLNESKVLDVVEKWSKQKDTPPSTLSLPTIIDSTEVKSEVSTDAELPIDPNEARTVAESEESEAVKDEEQTLQSQESMDVDVKMETTTSSTSDINIKVEKSEAEESAENSHTNASSPTDGEGSIATDDNVKPEINSIKEESEEPCENEVEKLNETDMVDGQIALSEIAENIKSAKTELGAKIKVKKKVSIENTVEEDRPSVYVHALRVLNLWKDLKEGFKIPRLVRQKRKEDEKEADRTAREFEEMSARGLPVNYNNRRGPDHKEYTIAGILKLQSRNTKKTSTERRQNGYHNGYNYNAGCSESPGSNGPSSQPQEPAQPKLSREEHRRQFEKEIIHKEYQEAMRKYEEQLRHYSQMFQEVSQGLMAAGALGAMPQLPGMPTMPTASQFNSYDPTYSYWNQAQTNQYPAMPLANGAAFSQSTSSDYFSADSETIPITYDEQMETATENTVCDLDSEQNEADYTAFEALFSHVPTLIECTGAENEIMSDEAAVLVTDYGIEYVPQDKQRRLFHSDRYPSPGIYYEFDDYVIQLPLDSNDKTCSMVEYLPADSSPEFLTNVQAPLPKYWRRAVSKSGRQYFFNKRTGETRWSIPVKEEPTSGETELANGDVNCDSSIVTPPVASGDISSHTPQSAAPAFSPAAPLQNGQASPADQMFPAVSKNPKPLDPDPRKRKPEPEHNRHAKVRKMASSSRSSSSNSKHHHSSSKNHSRHPISEKKRKRILDKFKVDMIEYIKKILNPYRKPDCKVGRITTNDDFKYLAKKLSKLVIEKEEKNCKSIEDLSCSDTVKKKTKEFIKKYMASKGAVYKGENIDKNASPANCTTNSSSPANCITNDSSPANCINNDSQVTNEDTNSQSNDCSNEPLMLDNETSMMADDFNEEDDDDGDGSHNDSELSPAEPQQNGIAHELEEEKQLTTTMS